MKKIILASSNQGKIRELNELLSASSIEFIPQIALGIPDIEETGCTFVENALIKARHAAKLSGLPALADDSGLVVNALNGAPGIYSSRYAGEPTSNAENNHKLLTEMHAVNDEHRHASYYCVLVLLLHEYDPMPLICSGKWSGIILREPRGNGGFGYDPLFYLPELQQTAAELAPAVKNKLSHRGQALKSLLTLLPEKLCMHSLSSN